MASNQNQAARYRFRDRPFVVGFSPTLSTFLKWELFQLDRGYFITKKFPA